MAQSKIREVVDDYLFRHLNLNVPNWYINPQFAIVLGSSDYARICAATPITFAPGLLRVLRSKTPPTIDFLKSLPRPEEKSWAVYLGLLVKPGCDPAICIGSGTDAIRGYESRVAIYPDKRHHMLPRFVRLAYDKGYNLAHLGVLCWAPLPSATMVPRARLLLVALEGVFTNLFYSARPTIMDPFFTVFMPWERNDVCWVPLNSHTPLNESTEGDLNLTDAELLRAEELRKIRMKEHSKKSYAKNAKKMREVYDRERAEDLEAFRKKKRIQARSWVSRNKPKVAAIHARAKQKALDEKRFYCKPCDKAFRDVSKLKRHQKTDTHQYEAARHSGRAKRAKRATPTVDSAIEWLEDDEDEDEDVDSSS